MKISGILNKLSTCLACETSVFYLRGADARTSTVLPFDPYEYVTSRILKRAEDLKPAKIRSRDLLCVENSAGENITRLRPNGLLSIVDQSMRSFAYDVHAAADLAPMENMILQLKIQDIEGTSQYRIVMDVMGHHRGQSFKHLGREEKEGYLPFEIPDMTINMDIFPKQTYPRDIAVGKLRHIESALREIYEVKRTPSYISGYCGKRPAGINQGNVVAIQPSPAGR